MLTRVTQTVFLNNIRSQLARNGARLATAQEQVATGKQVNRPSDDPAGSFRVLSLKQLTAANDQFSRNLDSLEANLGVAENVLGQTQEVLYRTLELAIQAANASVDRSQRAVIATEVSQQLDEVKRLGNTQLGARHLFAGYLSDKAPFARDLQVSADGGNTGTGTIATGTFDGDSVGGSRYDIRFSDPSTYEVFEIGTGLTVASGTYTPGTAINFDGNGNEVVINGAPAAGDSFRIEPRVIYQGDGNEIMVPVGEGQTVAANVRGHQLFLGDGNLDGTTDTGRVSVFAALEDLKFALEDDDQAGIQAVIDQLDRAVGQMSEGRGIIGGRLNLVDSAKQDLSQRNLTIEGLRSEIEDADMADAITHLTQVESVFQATLGTAARVVQQSLLDYL
jgi:flagellar hook-associated protein 3 FlgL